MTYISITFYLFVLAALLLYYILPLKCRWLVLLGGSIFFYWKVMEAGMAMAVILATIMAAYGMGLLLERVRNKGILAGAVLLMILPWFCIKNGNYVLEILLHRDGVEWIVPVGISFYTLQMISYLADVYMGRVAAQKNPAKFILYGMFFPQIVQGPIPRYDRLADQLYSGHRFDERMVVGGFYRILWGFFLKLMIADRAAVVVNEIFDNHYQYVGGYVLVAGVLYSIELYADFAACISISKGVANLFGIRLADNFNHPYLAVSVKDFWHRWHMSLSEWLKDYIYIPLGGSRKGRVRTYINLILTFIVSGIWHGAGLRFVVWGLMHAAYQIVGRLTQNIQRKAAKLLGLEEAAGVKLWIRRIWTFLCVMTAWIIFRAENLTTGIQMIGSMLRIRNLWIFTNDALLTLGLDWKEWVVLAVSVLILFVVSIKQERGVSFSNMIFRQPVYVRWALYLIAIFGIMTYGVYGMGYDSQAFIYGGF
ncbi:MAG: hypothetical protein K2N43_00265 [Lachnospiraceae bacterium]|nr:hypothetical protein [Lachnospiraceae bacterium]